jgi:DNA-binding GntR family transcriptional regulator
MKGLRAYNRLVWEATSKGDLSMYGRWNHEFHNIFLTCLENQTLRRLCDSTRKLLYAYPVKGKLVSEWMEKSAREHEEIIRLVRIRNSKRLETYFREVHWNFSKSRKYLEEAFHPDGQSPVPV